MHKQAEARPDFEYPDAKSFLSAVYLTAAPDTGGAVSDAMYMIRHLGRAHPDWIEEAVIELANASHRGVRIALADSLEYIEEQDPALARRLVRILCKDESRFVRDRAEIRREMDSR